MIYPLVTPHIASFNYITEVVLENMVRTLPSFDISDIYGEKVSFFISDLSFDCSFDKISSNFLVPSSTSMFPSECKLRGKSYFSRMKLSWCFSENGIVRCHFHKFIEQIPIMVMSNLCVLHRFSDNQLSQYGEEENECGGYFIVNGQEKLIRLLIVQRRNFPIALIRDVWRHKGDIFSNKGVVIRCVNEDCSVSTMTLHLLNNGSCSISISRAGQVFYIPFLYILKSLIEASDFEIFQSLMLYTGENDFIEGCIISMMRSSLQRGLYTQSDFLAYLGRIYRIKLHVPLWYNDVDVGRLFLTECICIHLYDPFEKFILLVEIFNRLYALAEDRISPDNADSPMLQEVLLPGSIYLSVLRSGLIHWMKTFRAEFEKNKIKATVDSDDFFHSINIMSDFSSVISQRMSNFLATGNASRDVLGLPQFKGLTILAERVNFHRYFSHFCSIHRGHFFTEIRTTSVRKLLPDAFGFLCPVNTPDGSPCGLLNHIAKSCIVTTDFVSVESLKRELVFQGMLPVDEISLHTLIPLNCSEVIRIHLNGRLIGFCSLLDSVRIISTLRRLKVTNSLSQFLEIVLVPSVYGSIFPGLYIFSTPGRFMRPLFNTQENDIEYVGSFEQVFLQISSISVNSLAGSHKEIDDANMLSILATLTPFSDHNQSPRNMYQCQMSKQTMGTPCHAFQLCTDNRLYRLYTPQSPIIRPISYVRYDMDSYAQGMNTIVAVISHTGYDMEDAMIINQYSADRGFAHGCVYRNVKVSLVANRQNNSEGCNFQFGIVSGYSSELSQYLDDDGLPTVGFLLMKGMPFYAYYDAGTFKQYIQYYQNEPCWVEKVTLIGSMKNVSSTPSGFDSICIKLRIPRNTTIGDKFASRHGQKGICSKLWGAENMPFSETGIIPDIIFNPHGFPSRMTIGMIIETIAGKAATLHGCHYDSSPFIFSQKFPAFTKFSEKLMESGYSYHGTERMYSGVSGSEFDADIFIGPIYYQRLRHMVSDKFQVRTTGSVNPITHQPVQGRKRVGGMRFGEMERDCLLSHGTSFILRDRLLNCSDKAYSHICMSCGSLFASIYDRKYIRYEEVSSTVCLSDFVNDSPRIQMEWLCNLCGDFGFSKLVIMPYVFRLFVVEMASMGIKINLRAN